MTPIHMIATLDRLLQQAGQQVDVVRVTGTTTQTRQTVTVTAVVRDFQARDLVPGLIQGDRLVILSPTTLVANAFPLPLRKGDEVVIGGRIHIVQSANPISAGDQLVRIELQVRG
jgi:hypothetical protein